MENNLNIEIDSNLDNVSVVRVAVSSFISSIRTITVEDLMDIKTAVSEAVTNSIEHGYEESKGVVKIECNIKSNEEDIVTISISDSGRGIEDIDLATTAAYTSKPEFEHAGLGFTIMESFMDEVIISSKLGEGTNIKLIKKIKNKSKGL